jgi:transposase-like protein
MKVVTPTVALRNGSVVGWSEFIKWSAHKQRMSLDPHTHRVEWGREHSEKMREIVERSYEAGTRKLNWSYGSKNGQSRAVVTPAGEFGSIAEAARHYQVRADLMRAWIRDPAKLDFRYLAEEDPEQRVRLRPGVRSVSTPNGVFPSISAAARHYGVGRRTVKTWIRGMRASEFSYVQADG